MLFLVLPLEGRYLKRIMRLLLFLLAIVPGPTLFSQDVVIGRVQDTVICRNDKKESYALFCPAGYDNNKSWPLILIFDPAARGRAGVDAFLEAGRKYGFILACSNNSRNGPLDNNLNAASAMLRDVQERFRVDGKRIYTAGFSGGSRFAITIAVMDDKISGVIGCGAGLPNDRNFLPEGNSSFLYYGLVGTRDMNYLEMLALPGFFSSNTRVISYIRSFSGGHQWPSPGLVTDAVEWLLLKSMDQEKIPDNQVFRTYIENKTQELIDSRIKEGDPVGAERYMSFASRDFSGTAFGTMITRKLDEYRNSSVYKKSLRSWNKIVSGENDSRQLYMNYMEEILKSPAIPDSASAWWKREVKALIVQRDKGNPDRSHMASRLLNFISIFCWEEGTTVYSYRLYSHAAFLFGICTISDSENPGTWYYLARSLAEAGKTTEAVDALYGAVKNGLKSRNRIESDPAFRTLRYDPRYKALIDNLK